MGKLGCVIAKMFMAEGKVFWQVPLRRVVSYITYFILVFLRGFSYQLFDSPIGDLTCPGPFEVLF